MALSLPKTKLIRTYYELVKPGIVYGNALTATAGFFFASQGNIHWITLAAMLLGLSCIIASACAINNYLDREIDARMERTKNRAVVQGCISHRAAIIFGTVLMLLGSAILGFGSNLLALAIALIGFFVYLLPYSIAKRRSSWSTHVGSIAGAVPPVVGYAAAAHTLDAGAFAIFLILVLWQMPHFFAIALYRQEEYAAAGIPVMPVQKGIFRTKIEILLYTIAFEAAVLVPFWLGLKGYIYLGTVLVLGACWIALAIAGFSARNTRAWARKMFFFSLIVLLLWCLVLSMH